jgi:hypothetical protein
VTGFLLPTNDFLILNERGVDLISLGSVQQREQSDSEGIMRNLHGLGMCDYLKIEPTNHILFALQFYDNRKLCIQQQYSCDTYENRGVTQFELIHQISISELTLRELLLMQSIFSVTRPSDIPKLIRE